VWGFLCCFCGALAKVGEGRMWMQGEWEARVNFEVIGPGGVNSPQLGMSQMGIWFPSYDLFQALGSGELQKNLDL
jgi:hypothetical protein